MKFKVKGHNEEPTVKVKLLEFNGTVKIVCEHGPTSRVIAELRDGRLVLSPFAAMPGLETDHMGHIVVTS